MPPEEFEDIFIENNSRKVYSGLRQVGVQFLGFIPVSGAPLTQEYADSIGAKGYAPDASSAVDLAKELLAQQGIYKLKVFKYIKK